VPQVADVLRQQQLTFIANRYHIEQVQGEPSRTDSPSLVLSLNQSSYRQHLFPLVTLDIKQLVIGGNKILNVAVFIIVLLPDKNQRGKTSCIIKSNLEYVSYHLFLRKMTALLYCSIRHFT
jgi:hypothetical protein